jgi:uncharacterized protein
MESIYSAPPKSIRTFTGKYLNVFEPTAEMICIEDVAHSLSQISRFNGQLPRYYSVAQHSLLCAIMAKPEHKLQALLHDASEGLGLSDLPTPIKNEIPEYKEIEHNLMKFISSVFDFQYPIHPDVKVIDVKMLENEWEQLMLNDSDTICGLPLYSPLEAKEHFLNYYKFLTQKQNGII